MTKPDPMYHFRAAGLEKRYEKRGVEANKGFGKASIILKCIECSGMEYAEAKICKINTCPLFVMNRKYFKGDQNGQSSSEPETGGNGEATGSTSPT